jgi:hypothetical protein
MPVRFPEEPPAEIRKGKKITIRGSTDPVVRRQRIRLMVARYGDENAKLLAKVRTRRDGTFRYAGWEPKEKGPWELFALYRSQRPWLASDFTCSRAFELVGKG